MVKWVITAIILLVAWLTPFPAPGQCGATAKQGELSHFKHASGAPSRYSDRNGDRDGARHMHHLEERCSQVPQRLRCNPRS